MDNTPWAPSRCIARSARIRAVKYNQARRSAGSCGLASVVGPSMSGHHDIGGPIDGDHSARCYKRTVRARCARRGVLVRVETQRHRTTTSRTSGSSSSRMRMSVLTISDWTSSAVRPGDRAPSPQGCRLMCDWPAQFCTAMDNRMQSVLRKIPQPELRCPCCHGVRANQGSPLSQAPRRAPRGQVRSSSARSSPPRLVDCDDIANCRARKRHYRLRRREGCRHLLALVRDSLASNGSRRLRSTGFSASQ